MTWLNQLFPARRVRNDHRVRNDRNRPRGDEAGARPDIEGIAQLPVFAGRSATATTICIVPPCLADPNPWRAAARLAAGSAGFVASTQRRTYDSRPRSAFGHPSPRSAKGAQCSSS